MGVVVYSSNSSIFREAEGSELQGHPSVHSEFKTGSKNLNIKFKELKINLKTNT